MASQKAPSSMFHAVYKECRVTESLLRSNFGQGTGASIIFLLPTIFIHRTPIIPALQLILKIIILGSIFQYTFDIVNQTTGVLEDTINKPYRPVPSGLITLRGAKKRWLLTWILSPLLTAAISGRYAALWQLVWQLDVGFCYAWPRPNGPITRNSFIVLGTLALVSHANAIAADQYPDRNMDFMLRSALSIWAGMVAHLQEFHDVVGDKASGKRTLAVILAPSRIWLVRKVTCLIFVVWHTLFFLWGAYLLPVSPFPKATAAMGVFQLLVGTTVGIRVVRSKSVETDRKNYFYGLGSLLYIMLFYVQLLSTAR